MEERRKRYLFSLGVAFMFVLSIVVYNFMSPDLAPFTAAPVGQVVGDNLTSPAELPGVRVSIVLDGDEFQLETGERIVMLGTRAPIMGQFFYQEAVERLRELIEGKNVVLEKDALGTDKHGRLLRYVYVGDTFVNMEMVRDGYANMQYTAPNTKYIQDFLAARNEARDAKRFIWQMDADSCIFCIEIADFNYDAPVDEEYITLRNICSFSCGMSNWVLSDEGNNMYLFSVFGLAPEATVTIHTSLGENTKSDLYWGREWEVWNNEDKLYLQDAEGGLVLRYEY